MRVLVTGAASGLRTAIVRRFLVDGIDVVTLHLDTDALDVITGASLTLDGGWTAH